MSKIDFSLEEYKRIKELVLSNEFSSKDYREQEPTYDKLHVLNIIHNPDEDNSMRHLKGLLDEYYNTPSEDIGVSPKEEPIEDTRPQGHEIVAQCELVNICKYFK